ncbi:MAG: peptide deformylase [bacterium]
MALTVEIYGSEVLRRKSEPVAKPSAELLRFARDMKAALREENGIGLAAPQVGRNIRLIIVDTRQDEELPEIMQTEGEKFLTPLMPVALFNPVLTPVGTDKSRFVEGCLSIPGVEGEVVRPVHVTLEAILDDETPVKLHCGGLLARCLQHEIDHLDGVMFVDRMNALDRVRIAPQLLNLKSRAKRAASLV